METEIIEQRTHAWLMQRVGKATGSRFKDVMARLKPKKEGQRGEPAQARKDYLAELVVERLTGEPVQRYVNAAMQWGTDMEPRAREAYVERTGAEVDEIGFVLHPTLLCGVSPDGIVDLEGLIEIKCPSSATHIETWQSGMDPMHAAQCQGAMWLCNAPWLDFVSYDPRFPAPLQLYIQRIQRDQAYIDRLEAEVSLFLTEVDQTVQNLMEKVK